jgi:hypothetical protein
MSRQRDTRLPIVVGIVVGLLSIVGIVVGLFSRSINDGIISGGILGILGMLVGITSSIGGILAFVVPRSVRGRRIRSSGRSGGAGGCGSVVAARCEDCWAPAPRWMAWSTTCWTGRWTRFRHRPVLGLLRNGKTIASTIAAGGWCGGHCGCGRRHCVPSPRSGPLGFPARGDRLSVRPPIKIYSRGGGPVAPSWLSGGKAVAQSVAGAVPDCVLVIFAGVLALRSTRSSPAWRPLAGWSASGRKGTRWSWNGRGGGCTG